MADEIRTTDKYETVQWDGLIKDFHFNIDIILENRKILNDLWREGKPGKFLWE